MNKMWKPNKNENKIKLIKFSPVKKKKKTRKTTRRPEILGGRFYLSSSGYPIDPTLVILTILVRIFPKSPAGCNGHQIKF
jgi:hypothetical protein